MANDPADDKMKEMQKSLKAYKGHFTRAITSAERLSKAMTKHEEVVADLVIQSQVHTIHCTQGLVTALTDEEFMRQYPLFSWRHKYFRAEQPHM